MTCEGSCAFLSFSACRMEERGEASWLIFPHRPDPNIQASSWLFSFTHVQASTHRHKDCKHTLLFTVSDCSVNKKGSSDLKAAKSNRRDCVIAPRWMQSRENGSAVQWSKPLIKQNRLSPRSRDFVGKGQKVGERRGQNIWQNAQLPLLAVRCSNHSSIPPGVSEHTSWHPRKHFKKQTNVTNTERSQRWSAQSSCCVSLPKDNLIITSQWSQHFL